MSLFSRFFSKNTNLKNVYPLLIGFNIAILLISLFSNSILASKFGTNAIKDNLELSLSISRNIVTSLGIGSLGGSTLYIISRSHSSTFNELSGYLTSIFLIQFLYSLIAFVFFLIFQNEIISLLAPNISQQDFLFIKYFLSCTSLIIILQPIIDIISASTTGFQIYGINIIGTAIQKISILIGVIFVSSSMPIVYPFSVVSGMLLAIIVLGYILYKKGFTIRLWSSLNYKDIKDTFRISLPWIFTSPFVNMINWMIAPMLINLGPGNYSVYLYAYLVYTLCISVIITPFSDAIGPALSKQSLNDDNTMRNDFLGKSFRLSFFIGVFFSSLLIGISKPVIGFLFLRGNLSLSSANSIAVVLIILCLSLGFQSTIIFLSRFFQSRISMINYVLTQLVAPILMLLFAYLFKKSITLNNVAIVISISSVFTGLLSWIRANYLLKEKLFFLDIKLILWSLFCLCLSFLCNYYLVNILDTPLSNFLCMVLLSPLFIITYLLFAKIIKVYEVEILINYFIQIKKKLPVFSFKG